MTSSRRVAKSAFATATHAIPVLRGTSARPLFVTAAGMPRVEAADLVRLMSGRFRLPDALRRVDQLARTGLRLRLGGGVGGEVAQVAGPVIFGEPRNGEGVAHGLHDLLFP